MLLLNSNPQRNVPKCPHFARLLVSTQCHFDAIFYDNSKSDPAPQPVLQNISVFKLSESYVNFCGLLTCISIHSFKETQRDAKFIFSIFRQTPLHVSGIFIAHHQEVHRMDTTIGTYCSF